MSALPTLTGCVASPVPSSSPAPTGPGRGDGARAAAGEVVICIGGPMGGGSLRGSPGDWTPGSRASSGSDERIEGVLGPVLRRSPRVAWFVAVDVAG